jgi:hypothetical protein
MLVAEDLRLLSRELGIGEDAQDEITMHRALIEACLTAATEPGATSPDIIRAAASSA